jgi:hypothetical protein
MKILIVLALAVCAYAQTPCDNIRTRAQWGSRSTSLTWMATRPPSGGKLINFKIKVCDLKLF